MYVLFVSVESSPARPPPSGKVSWHLPKGTRVKLLTIIVEL
jgi:hypothetical protein